MNYKMLIVDDEANNVRLLERLFRSDYEVIGAACGAEALELLELHDIALIITDQRMPGMTGIDFLNRAAELRVQTVRMILTGYTDANALVEALNSGVVYKYITKPWVNDDLRQTVRRAIQHFETIKNQHQLTLQNKRLKERLEANYKSFVKMVMELIDMKAPYLSGHVQRTRDFAVAIGRHLNLEPGDLGHLSLAALLHELAHFSMPNDKLLKLNSLTPDEQLIMKEQYESGLQMIADFQDLEDVATVIRYHHEHYDGSGFAEGLVGEQIPLHSRILAIANFYDEMTSPPQSQYSLTHDETIDRLKSAAGTKFDPELIGALCDFEPVFDNRNVTSESLAGLYA